VVGGHHGLHSSQHAGTTPGGFRDKAQIRHGPGPARRRRPGGSQAGCRGPESVEAAQRLSRRSRPDEGHFSDHGPSVRCPLLAQLRSPDQVRKRPMLGVDRTCDADHQTDANDPNATSRNPTNVLQLTRRGQVDGTMISVHIHQGFPDVDGDQGYFRLLSR